MNQSNSKSIKASVIREDAVPQFTLMGELLYRLKSLQGNQAEQHTYVKLGDVQVRKCFLYAHLCCNTVSWHLQILWGAFYAKIPPESRDAPPRPVHTWSRKGNTRKNQVLQPWAFTYWSIFNLLHWERVLRWGEWWGRRMRKLHLSQSLFTQEAVNS